MVDETKIIKTIQMVQSACIKTNIKFTNSDIMLQTILELTGKILIINEKDGGYDVPLQTKPNIDCVGQTLKEKVIAEVLDRDGTIRTESPEIRCLCETIALCSDALCNLLIDINTTLENIQTELNYKNTD